MPAGDQNDIEERNALSSHTENTLVSYKLLISEMKMNCQESVDTNDHDTEERRFRKETDGNG